MNIDKNKLDIAMARTKLNKTKLAEKAGIPVTTVCSMYSREIGKPENIGRIADALGVDVTEIIKKEN